MCSLRGIAIPLATTRGGSAKTAARNLPKVRVCRSIAAVACYSNGRAKMQTGSKCSPDALGRGITLSSTFKTPVQSHVLGPRRKRSLLFSTCNAPGQKADQRTSRGESGKPASPRAYLRRNGGGVGVGWEVERLPCCCFRMRGAQRLLPSERITVSLLRSACGLFAHARKTIWLAYNRPVRKLFGCARRGLLYVRRRMLGVRQGASR